MIGGAFAGATVAFLTSSAWAGLAAAVVTGAVVATVHGWVCITERGGQIVSAMALNLLLAGLCPALALGWFGQGGETPTLAGSARLDGAIGGIGVISIVAGAMVPVTALLLSRTRFGLHLRAAGENPGAVHAAGVSVSRVRYAALAWCGALAGVAGAYLSLADGTGFTRNLTAGRGYVALAALIFGRWTPYRTALACLLFAAADAIQIRFQELSLPIVGHVPAAFVEAFPALLTVVILALVAGRRDMPAALGQRFRSDR